MAHRLAGCLVIGAILVLGVSCTRLGGPGPGEQQLGRQELPQPNSIPAAWGKLVSVSGVPGVEYSAQLWFQDDEGIIRIVSYNAKDNYLSKRVRIINRD